MINTNNPPYRFSRLARGRRNVLDLIAVAARRTILGYLFYDIDMTWAESLRKKSALRGKRITVTALLLKSIAIAQRDHPASRSSILPWGRIVTFDKIVAGLTVEKFASGGPSVFFGTMEAPDTKPLTEIMDELELFSVSEVEHHEQLSRQSRFSGMPWLFRRTILWLGAIFPSIRLYCLGATFGLSSLGKLGIAALTGPCVCTTIFGVGTVEDRAVARAGKLEIHPMMTLTVSFDHRLMNGATAARFLDDIKALMEGGLGPHLQEADAAYLADTLYYVP